MRLYSTYGLRGDGAKHLFFNKLSASRREMLPDSRP
jgi:hypothetical protein